ncbi:MAG: hypothetical protein HGGPFJEG_01194 [Ignavibacteria bacterium]|nr:hypothetical protein [Ignavibacteria bacterium]
MKKFILLFCFLFISGYAVSQIYTEDFSYTAGTLITSTGNWNVASSGGTNPIAVISPGLEFPNYIGTNIGNAVFIGTTGEDDSSQVTPRQDSGSTYAVYTSFMLRVNTVQGNGDYFFALSSTGNAFDARVYARPSGAGFNIGITKANEATISYGSGVYSLATTYLVITKYQFIPGLANDEVSLFIYDSTQIVPSTEPSPTIGPITATSNDALNLSRVILRQGSSANASTVTVDGIYIDNSWNSAVLPVELNSFNSSVIKRDVQLSWSTSSESNNRGFDIERRKSESNWERLSFVNGNGTTASSHNYSYLDKNLEAGTYYYRLKQIDFNGNFEYFDLGNEVKIGTPEKYDLSQNYPNPFNPSTKINFDLPFDGNVSLKVFDVNGRVAAELVHEFRNAGYYTIELNAASVAGGLSSGVYFYTLTTENFVSTKKMLLIK